jgi:acyl transferase domain-containing protein
VGNNPPKSRKNKPLDIAIVGMAGLFPKANDLTGFWQNIINYVGTFAPVGK